jgi:CBS domain-containing protein
MTEKVATIKGDIKAESAIRNLYEKHIGSVVIVDNEGKCEGIFTTRDALRLIAQGVSLQAPTNDVMTKNPITVRETASISEAISVISSNRVRHLPVLDENDRLIGIFSIRSFLEEILCFG